MSLFTGDFQRRFWDIFTPGGTKLQNCITILIIDIKGHSERLAQDDDSCTMYYKTFIKFSVMLI